MSVEFDALYEEKRNAIPSWKGYQYQGKYAILRYLDSLVEEYKKNEETPAADSIKVRIEWIEDFIIYKEGKPSEIYQIKKDLNTSDRKEVIQNFIFQFKMLKNKNIKWILGYSTTKLTPSSIECSKEEFDVIYKNYISDKWIREIKKLEKNIDDGNYWGKNLNLNCGESVCKTIRKYVRNRIKATSYTKYVEKIEDRQNIAAEILKPLREMLKKKTNDYKLFCEVFYFEQLEMNSINDRCKERIEFLSRKIPKYELLIADEAVALLLYDLECKMEAIKTKKEAFEYNFTDFERIVLSASLAKKQWAIVLENIRKNLNDSIKEKCEYSCKPSETCEECILNTVEDWSMPELIDNLNLDYPRFAEGVAVDSYRAKGSDERINALVNILFALKDNMRLENDEIIYGSGDYTASMILGTEEKENEHINHRIYKKVLDNYLEHERIYRDHDAILTDKFSHNVLFKKCNLLSGSSDSDDGEMRSFFDEKNVEFIHYKKVKE